MNDAMKGTENYDPTHRVRRLLYTVHIHCLSIYHTKQHLAVDVRMVATKARAGIKTIHEGQGNKMGTEAVCVSQNDWLTQWTTSFTTHHIWLRKGPFL